MARKVTNLKIPELEKMIRLTAQDVVWTSQTKIAKMISGLLSKAFDEGFDEGSEHRRPGFGH